MKPLWFKKMRIQDKAKILAEANRQSNLILDEIRNAKKPDYEFVKERLRRYCGMKLLLPEQDISDNITLMAQMAVARAMHIEVTDLPGVDRPGQCGGASAVLSKRIQLLLAIQKGLNVRIEPKETPHIHTVDDLAKRLVPLLK